jgi:hypothetical protein
VARFAALDTQLLYGDSCAVAHHRKAIAHLRGELRFDFVICPTVWFEIRYAEENGTKEIKERTHLVLQDIEDSTYIVHRSLKETYEKAFRKHALHFLESGVLPNGAKVDARVLIEASYFDCTELLTTRTALLDANPKEVNLVLLQCGLNEITVLSPKQFI